jgi:tetratricopeptide (TPR) repeat protein
MQRLKISFRIVALILAATLITACSKEVRKARFLRQADNYFKAGDYDKAKVSYLNALQLDPQNALALERIGAMWQEDGAPLRAAAFLAKASELDPKNAQNQIRLARCYVALGQLVQARREALKVLNQAPDNGDAIVVLTEAARSKEDIQAAEEQLQKFPKKNDASFHLASANLFFSQGNFVAAGNSLQQALTVDPRSSQAHMAIGNFYLAQKDQKQAGEEFKKAADLAPVRSIERLKYAGFKSAVGDAEETRRVATEMTKQAPDYLPGWILLAELSSKEKKYDEALALLGNVFGRDADNIDGHALESNVLLAKGDTKKAVEVLERLDQTYPGAPLIKYQLGRAYVQNKSLDQARAALDQAVSMNPNYDDAVLLLAQVNLSTGHPEPVIEPMIGLLKRRPDLRDAALLLAGAYSSLERFGDAAAVLQEQAKLTPQDPQPEIALGVTYRQAKKNDEARQAFEKAAELAPDNLFPVDQLIDLDLLDKHFDAARQRIRRQFQRKTDLPPAAHYWEGKILAEEGKWDSAEAELQRTLQLDPNFSGAYDLLVRTYVATNRLPQAVTQLQALLAKNPNNPPTLMTLALLNERMQDYQQARDAYEKLLSIQPNFVPALNNLAYLYAEHLNDLDKAYDLADKARGLQEEDASVGDTFGWVLYKRGDYQQALPILQQCAAKTADNPEIQFHLGMTAYMMGRTDLARAALQKAASAAKDFPDRDESKRRLAQLQGSGGQTSQLSINELEALLKQQPNDLIVVQRLAETYEREGDAAKAGAAYEQMLKLNPKLPAPTLKLAQLYAGPLRQGDKALQFARKARELAPNDPEAAGLLGRIALKTDNFSWAYSLLQESARQRRNDPDILHDLAMAAYALGRVPEARQTMQRSLDAAPGNPQFEDGKQFLGMTALDQISADVVAAEAEVQKILKTQPDYVPALMAQAAIQLQRNDAKSAAGTYLQVLRQFPDFAPAQKRLAAIYVDDLKDLDKAYDLAIKARKTLSDDPELARTLAELNFKRKQFPFAIRLFEESAAKQSLPAKDLYYLGMAQLQTQQEAKGRETLQNALSAGLQEPLAQDAKKQLAESQPK